MFAKVHEQNRMKIDEMKELILKKAEELGLDFFPTIFEIVPANVLYTFGAYAMPTRYSHWSFGRDFFRMKTMYDYGMGKIYELVINSNPCYAFLMEDNTVTQNMLIIAHVLAHNDFFKNNCRFKETRRDMVEAMALAANKITEYEKKYGKDRVEELIDAASSIAYHIDPYGKTLPAKKKKEKVKETPYDDLWNLEIRKQVVKVEPTFKAKKIPETPEFDILRFVINHNRSLEPWQKDVLTIIRDEMFYFWPQIETKLMNEGWATYWHLHILRELELDTAQTIDYAAMHAGVVTPSPYKINPYYVGWKIFEDIRERWDNPTEEEIAKGREPGKGLEKIFEVRANETDASFIRNYLTEKLVEDLDLYIYEKTDKLPEPENPRPWYKQEKEREWWIVEEKKWEKIRDALAGSYATHGIPLISVEDANYRGQFGTGILLKHHHEGSPLHEVYCSNTLAYVSMLWNCEPVYLHTIAKDDDMEVTVSYDPQEHKVSWDVRGD